MASEPVLQVRDLGKRFGATRALAGVTLQFCAGEIHCVLGENGAGKSTLGKIAGGLFPADEGEVLLNGNCVRFASPREARSAGVTMVYQELSLAPHLSVRANLWLGFEGRRFPLAPTLRKAERQRAASVLSQLGLAGIDMEQPVKALPVAVQQLIEIGKSLMFKPKAVIFDEPTAMLGAVEKERFFAVLRTLRDSGIAAVLVTHHIEDVMTVADRVTIMRNGSVVDSFALTPDIDADQVVERLTGKRQQAAMRQTGQGSARAPLVDIEAVPTADGPRTLTIARGEIAGFYGVVGCGAEKLVRALTGQDEPAHPGPLTLRLDGRPYRPRGAADALAHGVAWLPAGRASHGVLPGRSIRENLLLTQLKGLSRFGFIGPARERTRCAELLEACQVKFGDAEHSIMTLSGGNQQKVLLARAMAGAKRVLVLEEPSAGVDIDAKRQIHQRIRAIAQTGIAVVVLSSDLPETLALCDTVITMYAGAVANIYRQPTEADQPSIIADVLGQHEAQSEIAAAVAAV
ncbi:ABC-type sugar transport system, ATPase component [Burkholderia sp. Ch1-1]|uniref:ABC-type sugar transport system, ATPase component n=1 Tax=Paraburkholderia dioscoreae TaxID=2604047 RepID=A0A5Q4ZMU5_9BURK|nr:MULTISPECIES: sugar ABC transporter ATP-binding protein [Paraburkholderia]EIF34340.1 ABC-type sugar transport system, ATPase component [Burkholderia sp. Ch1-1]MDR8395207.1 sugar ABC transporter ATP-binding protein [Paraburkholderia sp. USG1]VVD33276.1 ABC-type sugar transport system, ATPase component [Paraburkholderia dioscoreae]